MTIGLDDLDPSVASALSECIRSGGARSLSQTEGSNDSPPDIALNAIDRKRLKKALSAHRWLGGGLSSFVPVGAAFACVMLGAQYESQPLLMGGLFALSFIFSGGSLWHTLRKDLILGFRTHIPSEVVAAAAPLMKVTPMERAYVETIAVLLKSCEGGDDHAGPNLLPQLGELLDKGRQLDIQRETLLNAIENHSVSALEADRSRYQSQLSVAQDEATITALQQSLKMCELRLQDARMMEQNLRRVEAQREAIQQTLASVQSSLLRRQTTPALATTAIEEITSAISEIKSQTKAVEEAVHEVESNVLVSH